MTRAASGRGLQPGLVGAGARERQRLGTGPPAQSRRGDRASARPLPEPERQQQPALGWGTRGPVAAFARVRRRPDAYGRTLRTSAELWPEVEARDTCPEIINVEKNFKLWIQARSPRERAAGEEV